MTLKKVECGLRSIKDADSNPDWQGGDEVPQYIAAKPDPGNDFCILHWSWSNVGKEPDETHHAGDVVINDERFAASSEDETRGWTIMDTHLGISYAAEINPRKSTKTLDVYQVPEGETVTGVWFPAETMVQGSGILVAAS